MNCVKCNKSPALDSSNLFNSFIVLEDKEATNDSNDDLFEAIKTQEAFHYCLKNNDSPNVTLCVGCADSLHSKANLELSSISQQVRALFQPNTT